MVSFIGLKGNLYKNDSWVAKYKTAETFPVIEIPKIVFFIKFLLERSSFCKF